METCNKSRTSHISPYSAAALVAPPLVAGAALFVACRGQYQDGLGFVPGLHAFAWIIAWGWLTPCFLATTLVPLVIGIRARGNRRVRRAAYVSAALCAVLALGSFWIVPWAFEAGRDRAYRAADLALLVAGCRAIDPGALSEPPGATSVSLTVGYASYSRLPPEILAFKPILLLAGRRGVVVQMDGGGPASHEGFFVPLLPLPNDVDDFARKYALRVLSRDPPVFSYVLYDSRTLPFE